MNETKIFISSTLYDEKTYSFYQVKNDRGENFFLKRYSSETGLAQSKIDIEYEFGILSRLDLPNVIKPLSVNTAESSRELLISYLPGKTLRHHIKNSTLTFSNKVAIINAIAYAIDCLHNSNIVYQNLSPEKILCTPENDEYKITFIDMVNAVESTGREKTNTSQYSPTNKYFSPEQTGKINKLVDARTDLYNLGLIAFELFLGYFPFVGDTLRDLVYAHVAKAPDLEEFSKKNPAYGSIIQRLLDKDPDQRYQNSKTLIGHLQIASRNFDIKLSKVDHVQDGNLHLSQKLYGREKELAILGDVADKARSGPCQLVLVSGYSGIGKSALIKEIQKPICQHSGHFLSGKFEQLGHNIPLKAFIQAFQAITRYFLSESQQGTKEWVSQLTFALGDNLKVVTDVIPDLLHVVGEVREIPKLQTSEELNRFVLAFTHFMQVCCEKESLVVLFLDDMQWADSTSLSLLESICANQKISKLMIICAYRKNEVPITHPFHLCIDTIKKQRTFLHRIDLSPLKEEDITTFLRDSLSQDKNTVKPLSNIVIEKTLGNPFFVNQLITEFYDTGLLNFDNGVWTWDDEAIKQANISDNVVDLVAKKIILLSSESQLLIKNAAAVGNRFSLNLLHDVTNLSTSKLFAACKECLENGFICLISGNSKILFLEDFNDISLGGIVFKFLHDRIQQAAYELIDINNRPSLHLKIGRALYYSCTDTTLDENLFDITLQVNQGRHLIKAEDKHVFASLNLKAGITAQRSGSYIVAEDILLAGCEMIQDEPWNGSKSLIYQLHIALLEAQYLCTHYQDASITSEKVLLHCPDLLDQAPVYVTQILNHIGNNQMAEAVDKAVWVVNELGIDIKYSPPEKIGPFSGNSLQATTQEIFQLAELAPISNENARVALSILVIAGAPAYFSSPNNFEKICFTMLSVCTEFGNSPDSAYAYAYAGIMCSGKGYFETGYQYCQLGLKMLDEYDNKAMKPQILEIFNVHVRHWCDPVRECLFGIQEGVQAAQKIGGIEFASYNAAFYCSYLVFVGNPLTKILNECEPYWHILHQFGQEFCISYAGIWISLVQELAGDQTQNTPELEGVFDREKDVQKLIDGGNLTALFSFYQSIAFHYLLQRDYDKGLAAAEKAEEYSGGVSGMRNTVENCFCHALCLARSTIKLEEKINKINYIIDKLTLWNSSCQGENTHKITLVNSEIALLNGDIERALILNSQAASIALDKGYLQDHVLAKILGYDVHRKLGNDNISLTSFDDMLSAFLLWGADGLAAKYLKNTPEFLGRSDYLVSDPSQKLIKRRSSGLQKEEIDALLNILASLSQETDEKLVQEKLLSASMNFVGAERASLLSILDSGTQLTTSIDGDTLLNFDDCNDLTCIYSKTVVNYCLSTQKIYHCGDAQTDPFFVKDEYIRDHQVRSILCLPITGKSRIIAMVYMENNLSSHVFSPTQIEWVSSLIRQCTIALDNARLYGNLRKENEERKLAESALEKLNMELEKRIEERTSELKSANNELTISIKQLKTTQSRLVESEKMASLGGLVAGLAHEINTPIGTSLTSATCLDNHVNRVAELFESKSLTESSFKEMVEVSKESSAIIVRNLRRASELIRSFKRVSVDQTNSQLSEFDLVECIQDVVISLRPKYKHIAINIDIRGCEALMVFQVSGAIAQLITNLLINALDHAFFEKDKGNIIIDVQKHNNNVKLLFLDDGLGMDKQILSKIFEPFFTTKRGTGGSGLGMHIVYNLVQQTLKGFISVNSTPGHGSQFTIEFPKSLVNFSSNDSAK